jgi:SAM-dependent methyltransferase
MTTAPPPIFDRMSALADATRSRLLLVLDRHEMTVGELCRVLQLPQSTVSRHLKTLGDEGWVAARAEGTSRRYRMRVEELDPTGAGLWELVRGQVAGLPAAAEDGRRIRSVLAERTTASRAFFSTSAGEWDRLRAELYGRTAHPSALLGLLEPHWTVGDLGCGTGQMADALAPFVGRVVAVDASPAMLEAARARLEPHANVEVREGELEALPVDAGSLDAAVLFLVLHYLPEPGEVLAEVARVLKPGGRLLLVDMARHDREEYRHTMGHLWQGFDEAQLAEWCAATGLERPRLVSLPPDPAARGPSLFAARAVRSADDDAV